MTRNQYYYFFLIVILVIGIAVQLPRPDTGKHYVGTTLLRSADNSSCTVIWQSGWDYDSFFSFVYVNDVNVSHPYKGETIYRGNCTNITTTAYNKPVQSVVTISHYSG